MIIRAFSISQFQFDGAQLIPHRLARVFCTGIIPGLLWKKIYRYTVINYNDGFMDHVKVLDFHKDAERGSNRILPGEFAVNVMVRIIQRLFQAIHVSFYSQEHTISFIEPSNC